MYMQSKRSQQVLRRRRASSRSIEDLSRYPDWRLQVANIPAAITCTDVMAEQHPELAVTFMKGMIKVGRWANEHKRAAAAILDKQTFYLDVEHTYQGIKDVDMVPNLSPLNLASVEIGKNFMLRHGYIKHDFDVQEWAAPEFLEQAAKELLEAEWKKRTTSKLPDATELLDKPGGSGRGTGSAGGVRPRPPARPEALADDVVGRIVRSSGASANASGRRLRAPRRCEENHLAEATTNQGAETQRVREELCQPAQPSKTRMQQLGYRPPTDSVEPDQLVLVEYVSGGRVAHRHPEPAARRQRDHDGAGGTD